MDIGSSPPRKNKYLGIVPDPWANLHVIIDTEHRRINWERGNVALGQFVILAVAFVVATAMAPYLLVSSDCTSLKVALAVGFVSIPIGFLLEIWLKFRKCKSRECRGNLKPSAITGFCDLCSEALQPETARRLAMLYMEARYAHLVDPNKVPYYDEALASELQWLCKRYRLPL